MVPSAVRAPLVSLFLKSIINQIFIIYLSHYVQQVLWNSDLISSPPFVYIKQQKYQFDANTIYLLIDNIIVIYAIDNYIQFINQDLEVNSFNTISYIYFQRFYIWKKDEIENLVKKNKIVSFVPNLADQLAYVIKQKLINIEMGFKQIYCISKTQPYFLYQSIVFFMINNY
ncbi:unnamed protein product [Paramecium primaurelia]|uniref:Uncharacterized protein n=1 Tax=Paramecium primaurelia TaxID=5886 RepID=A0A8S1Q5B1_PARPR|nr:unnamed protein product [Paramecium primaurelia]